MLNSRQQSKKGEGCLGEGRGKITQKGRKNQRHRQGTDEKPAKMKTGERSRGHDDKRARTKVKSTRLHTKGWTEKGKQRGE